MLIQTVLIVFWVLIVGIISTAVGKWLYDNWLQPIDSTYYPTSVPTSEPTAPSAVPSAAPTPGPTTAAPTAVPTAAPTPEPTSAAPTVVPTAAPTSDNCFEMAYYYCLTCVPQNMQPILPCGSNYYAPGKCPDNAICSNGRYTCNAGYRSTYVDPRSWGNYCQYCSLSYTCVPMYLRH